MELERKEIRTILYCCWKRGLKGRQIAKDIIVTERTCQNWVKQFNKGNFDFEEWEDQAA